MNSGDNCVVCGVLIGAVISLPVAALALMLRLRREPPSRAKKISRVLGASMLAVYLVAAAGVLVHAQPWRSGILAQGFSPDGREYCVVQTFQDIVEPYKVSFYLRDTLGLWRWHYLAHDDTPWGNVVAEFTPATVRISRNGTFQSEIPRDAAELDPAKLGAGEQYRYRPAGFSVADVLAFHGRQLPR